MRVLSKEVEVARGDTEYMRARSRVERLSSPKDEGRRGTQDRPVPVLTSVGFSVTLP